jgi:hypothetical protein
VRSSPSYWYEKQETVVKQEGPGEVHLALLVLLAALLFITKGRLSLIVPAVATCKSCRAPLIRSAAPGFPGSNQVR